MPMIGFGQSWTRHATKWVAIVAVGVVGAVSTACGSSPTTTVAQQGQQCGQDVSYINKIKDPDGVFKQLPAAIQANYGPWPYQVKSTPWLTFAGKPPPWTIG